MKKHIDPMTQTFILLVLVVILSLIAFKKNDKIWWAAVAISALLLAMRAWAMRKAPALILENDYKGNGCYKCESENDCIIRPLATLTNETAIDGINTKTQTNKVYKMNNGIYAKITADGNVRPYSFVSRWFVSGWVDTDYFKAKGALEQWKPLFECQTT